MPHFYEIGCYRFGRVAVVVIIALKVKTLLVCALLLVLRPSWASIEVVSEVWPPYSYLSDNGEPTGVIAQPFSKALAQGGVKHEIRYYPWSRAYHKASMRPDVLIFPIYRNPEREDLFHWFCPISKPITILAISRTDSRFNVNSIEDLIDSGAIVGVMRNDNSFHKAVALGFSANQLDISASEVDNVRKLAHKRIDVIFQSWESFQYRLKKVNVPLDAKFKSGAQLHTIEESELCAAMSTASDKKLVNKVRYALSQLIP